MNLWICDIKRPAVSKSCVPAALPLGPDTVTDRYTGTAWARIEDPHQENLPRTSAALRLCGP